MPRIRVSVGPSLSALEDISDKVNTGSAHDVVSEAFEGRIAIHLKGFTTCGNQPLKDEFFQREDRRGITWSIQVQGRFLRPHSADDILFGNVFRKPFKLPWGSNAVLKFMKFLDPTLEHDMTSGHKPWALSPLISTMTYFAHSHIPNIHDIHNFPQFPSPVSLTDDVSQLCQAVNTDQAANSEELFAQLKQLKTPCRRRAYFSDQKARDQILFGPDDIINTEFCYGFLEFYPEPIVRIPGGLTFRISKYWKRKRVRFVCCERQKAASRRGNQDPWGRIFWCVSIELEE